MSKTLRLLYQITEIHPDPVTYKPNNPTYVPKIKMFVALDVPEKYIISHSKTGTILTDEGAGFVYRELATITGRGYHPA